MTFILHSSYVKENKQLWVPNYYFRHWSLN